MKSMSGTQPINIDPSRRMRSIITSRQSELNPGNLSNTILSIVASKNRGLGIGIDEIVGEVTRQLRITNTRSIINEIDYLVHQHKLIYPLNNSDTLAIPYFIEDVYSIVGTQPEYIEDVITELCLTQPDIYSSTLRTCSDITAKLRIMIKLGYLQSNNLLEVYHL